MGLVSALMSLKEHKNVRELLYTIEDQGELSASGQDLGDELLVTTLVRCTPGRLRTHVQLQLTPDTTYNRLKLTLMGFEEATEDYKFKGVMLPTSSARPILRDAQGAQIHIADMRDLKLITQDSTGQNVCIKGTFAVGPTPLLSLGILLKQGWSFAKQQWQKLLDAERRMHTHQHVQEQPRDRC